MFQKPNFLHSSYISHSFMYFAPWFRKGFWNTHLVYGKSRQLRAVQHLNLIIWQEGDFKIIFVDGNFSINVSVKVSL